MNIDEMLAGREMNLAIIALMGWPISKNFREDLGLSGWQKWHKWIDWLRDPSNYPYVRDVGDRLIVFRLPKQDGKTWSPSTGHADAWEVVEKLGELTGKDVLVEHCADGDRMCTTGAHYRGLWMKDVQAIAPTVPLAICRAALKVAGSNQYARLRSSLTTAILSSLPRAFQGKLGESK